MEQRRNVNYHEYQGKELMDKYDEISVSGSDHSSWVFVV